MSLPALGAPMQPAKIATTPYNIHITRQASPLPELPTANIDRSSLTVRDGGVLVHYISNDVDFATATQVIIVIHGLQRDANNAFAEMQGAVKAANKSKVVIVAVRSPFHIYLRIIELIHTCSLSSSMATIRARFHGRMARPPPINSYGRVSVHSTYCTESII
jgi:predicted alpha/beta-fold hydrolase